ncbi:MAG: matrixin family metalloprotease, partial [Limisphaerales bacterium]
SLMSVGKNLSGALEVFGRGTDNAVWHMGQTSANGTWTGWYSLAGVLTSAPIVGSNADGRLEIFYRGQDNALWTRWQLSPGGSWSGEQQFQAVISDAQYQ